MKTNCSAMEGESATSKCRASSVFDNDSPKETGDNRCNTLLLTFTAKGQIHNGSCE
jgi:hypothetical protein